MGSASKLPCKQTWWELRIYGRAGEGLGEIPPLQMPAPPAASARTKGTCLLVQTAGSPAGEFTARRI